MKQHNADTFAPLVEAGFPNVQPGEVFTVAGDHAIAVLGSAGHSLPAPWIVVGWTDEPADEPADPATRQWRCQVIDNRESPRPNG
jgi:hypothetical protein